MAKQIRWYIVLCGLFTFATSHAQRSDSIKAEDILNMSFTDLMNIQVVSGSKIQQNIAEVAASVRVITDEQIRDRSYFTLEEALSDLPGFQFRNIVGFNSYVFMRGATSQNNLILLLVDGVQINELNSGGFYAGGQFNLSEVEQIEVVYGPASALYGTNAVSGVINIITKKPDGQSKGHVSLLGGNFKTGMTDFNLQRLLQDKNLSYSVSGMVKTSEKANLRGSESDHNWSDEMENFENDLSLSAKINYGAFQAGVLYQEKYSSNTTYHLSNNSPFLDKNTRWDIGFLNSYLKYVNDKHEKWTWSSQVYYRNATLKPNTIFEIVKATDTTAGKQVGYYRPNQLVGLENQVNFLLSENLFFVTGIVIEAEQLSKGFSITESNAADEVPPTPDRPEMLTNRLMSYYVQGNWKIWGPLSFVGGWRQDFSSYYGQVFTPRSGILFNQDRLSAKILLNKAFRAPKPWDYTSGLGNALLDPEKMQSIEFDLSYTANKNWALGGAAYFNKIQDKLTKEIVSDSYRWINKNELSTFGLELFSKLQLQSCILDANYTYNHSMDQNQDLIPEIAMHTANASVTFTMLEDFRINIRTNYLGIRYNPTNISATGNKIIDDALVFHGAITYLGIQNFDFQLKLNNMLNTEYYHPSNLFDGRYRQPQRTILFKTVYHF